MCGIAGFWGEPNRHLLTSMTDIIRHRGPDDEGHFESPMISLGHRRLSIIDIDRGHQPIGNEDGQVQIVFNGEVYNYRELRDGLRNRGHVFHTDTDTEVILHAYEEYGPGCFSRFNGMWAVAIADLPNQRLVLARDHFGIKPLYYAKTNRRIDFASEIKALLEDPELRVTPNDQMIYEYLGFGLHDHTSETFFKGILRLPSASFAIIDASGISIRKYWQPRLSTDGDASPERFAELLRKSVERRLRADVPVGACLSGGLDSSTIVSLMSELVIEKSQDAVSVGDRVKTFSAVFDDDPIDERDYIVAEISATRASSDYCHPSSARFVEEMEDMIWHQEEPIVSTGPYAQWDVMREARGQVTVLLDGQGGDELLGGYVPYQIVYLRQLLKERRFATLVREALAARDVLIPFVRATLRNRKGQVGADLMLRPEFTSRMSRPKDTRPQDNLKERLVQDLLIYSLPCLLRYEDKNSMAFSLESRVPYLDQDLVAWALSLPESALIHNGWSRAIVREGMRGVLPDVIRERRWKVGFTTPESRWIKARRVEFSAIIASPDFQKRKYWNGLLVASEFAAAVEGRREWTMLFWRAVNVELWLRVFFTGPRRSARAMAAS